MTLIERLRCYGCPAEPFSTMRAVEVTRAEPLYKHAIDYDDHQDFEWVALERKFDARPIESATVEGWAFFELDKVDAGQGGAPRAHVDALRLMAVFLAHWDNKPENQRMVCLAGNWPDGAPCPRPFLMIQDAGATFGPSKVDLDRLGERRDLGRSHAVHRQPCGTCRTTAPRSARCASPKRAAGISRRLLAQLSDRQLTDLFSGARFDKKRGLFSGAHPVAGVGRACSRPRCRRSARGRRARRRSRCRRGLVVVLQRERRRRRSVDAAPRDRLEVQIVAVDLDQHEVIVAVEGARDVTAPACRRRRAAIRRRR